jgi:hypothetical protein
MTRRELINKLEAMPVSDDARVWLWDIERDANQISDGDSASTSMYDFEIGVLNESLTEDEKEHYREAIGIEPEPFIAITFSNPDYEDLEAES